MSISRIEYTPAQEEELIQQLKDLVKECEDDVMKRDLKDMDYSMLLIVLRYGNHNVRKAFNCCQRLTLARRQKYVHVFDNLYPEYHRKALDAHTGPVVLKQRDKDGKHILIYRFKYWDLNKFNLDDVMGCILLTGLEMLQTKETQLNGLAIVLDVEGFSLKHARYITPALVQQYVDIIINLAPLKFKELHAVNVSWIFNATLSLIKMFLSQKMRKVVYAHSSMEGLHKWISPTILPPWLGGNISEEESLDPTFYNALCTKERDDFYRQLINPNYLL